jgi:RNA polymerase sigma factor (sigma-70 family)
MKPVSAPTALRRAALAHGKEEEWHGRSARLYEEFARPARSMIRRAFRGAFGADELDDIYASAWVGTLRALEPRHHELSDEQIRSYVFTAVAHQAGKEVRRRTRKPVAPLELAASVADHTASSPEDSATAAEQSRVTRDLLASLPPRRRAVILLRYGWGLEPKQICELIKDLSPRAYRKEVTRGVDELTEKIRSFERGDWCTEREPVLKAYAAGLADPNQERQAQAHLAHCRTCSDFVAKLGGHLHDLGSATVLPGAVDGIDGHLSLVDRVALIGERTRDAAVGVFERADSSVTQEAASNALAAGGARGAGAAGVGALAKLAGIGTAGKLAVVCLGGTAAVTACVAAGVSPIPMSTHDSDPGSSHNRGAMRDRPGPGAAVAPPVPAQLPSQVGHQDSSPSAPAQPVSNQMPGASADDADTQLSDTAAPAPAEPVAPTTPPAEQEFDVPAAAAPAPTTTASDGSSGSSGSSGDGSGSAIRQEFTP